MSDFGPDSTVERTREFAYDRAGNPTRVTDALGAATTYTYDALNRLTSITRPVSDSESITTSYGYDRAGNLTRATDGNGNTTVFTVNAWNAAESTIEPATEQTPEAADRTYTASYDAAGRLAELRKPGGVTIAHSYDPQGNLVKQVGSGASVVTPDRMFTYDPAGRMVSASAPNGENTFTYDDRGNLVTASGPSGESSFTYDADGLPTSVTTSGRYEFVLLRRGGPARHRSRRGHGRDAGLRLRRGRARHQRRLRGRRCDADVRLRRTWSHRLRHRDRAGRHRDRVDHLRVG